MKPLSCQFGAGAENSNVDQLVFLPPVSPDNAIMSGEKWDSVGLPSGFELVRPHPPFSYKHTKALIFGLCLGALAAGVFFLQTLTVQESSAQVVNELCPQVKPIIPVEHFAIWDSLVERGASDEYKKRTIERLSGAVRIRYASCLSLVSR